MYQKPNTGRTRFGQICPGQPGPRLTSPGLESGSGESGQIMVLLIGYVVLALLLVTVVSAASSIYIGQKKLLSVADGAALAAADGFTLGAGAVAGEPGKPAALLAPAQVNNAVAKYLAETGSYDSIPGLVVAPGAGTTDGRTAQVSLAAVVHPMFINFLVPDGVPVTVTSTARSQLVK